MIKPLQNNSDKKEGEARGLSLGSFGFS